MLATKPVVVFFVIVKATHFSESADKYIIFYPVRPAYAHPAPPLRNHLGRERIAKSSLEHQASFLDVHKVSAEVRRSHERFIAMVAQQEPHERISDLGGADHN